MRITIATTLFLLPLLTSAAPYQCDTHALLKLTPIDVSYFFEYSTPAHVSRKSGNINFTLTNDQVDEPTQCTGSSQLDFGHFYGFQMFECTPPGTLFSFDSSTNVVGLNMTWTCQDVPYAANTHGTLDLKCETTTWKNPNWKIGETYSNTSTVCQGKGLIIQA